MRLRLFRDRNFLLLMQGSAVSQLGTLMQTFALSLYVLNHYDSTTLFASILIISAIPRLVLGPFAGVLVDWFDRKKIIVRLDILSGLCVLLLSFLYFSTGELPLWSIYTIAIALSLIGTLFSPAVNTVVPNIMKEEDLLEANSINHMLLTICSLIAPLLAGLLMSFSVIGWVLLINGISFLVSALSESFIQIPKTHKAPQNINLKLFKDDFAEGINMMRSSRFIMIITFIALALNFAITPVFTVGVPHILKKVMIVQDYEYGIVNSIIGSSSLLAGYLTAKYAKRFSVNSILKADLIAQPITVGLLAIVSSFTFLQLFDTYYLPLVLFMMIGFIFIIILTAGNITINTTIQKIVPKDMLGRVGTVITTLCGAAVPIGQALFGLMVDSMGHFIPMISCTVILLIVAICSIILINKEEKTIETPTFDSMNA